MTRDIININDFIILVEEANSTVPTIDSCLFDESVIAVAFYGSGNVNLRVKYPQQERGFDHTKGLALSFYADNKVEFIHTVRPDKPLECIVVATSITSLAKLPNQEGELFGELLNELVNPSDHYVEGPSFFMTPEMQLIIDQVFHNRYEGKARMMFFRSQMTVLLSHFFGQLSLMKESKIPERERVQLNLAKEILSEKLDNPPSLTELAKEIGLNSYKLKKNFKALFGVPVFKYLQNERLNTAHELIRNGELSIQEAAWKVGYDSLSSFSNAFADKFGFRPSAIKQ